MNTLASHDGGPGPFLASSRSPGPPCSRPSSPSSGGHGAGGGAPGRAAPGSRGGYDERSPIAITDGGFASGGIDEDEYGRRLSVLDERFGRRDGRSAAL